MKTHCYKLELCLAALLLLSSCGGHEKFAKLIGRQEQPQSSQIVVKVMPVVSTSNAAEASYVGKVEARKSVNLSSQYSGTLDRVYVRQGQRVSRSQAIAHISSATINSTYENAAASLRQAQDGYDRLQKVYQSGSVAQVKMVEIETKLAQAKAMEAAARKAKDDCTIRAPYSGTIGEVYVNEGEELGIAAPVASLLDLSVVEVHFSVPERELSQIKVGAKARFSVPALEKETTGSIVRKGVTAAALSHSYECVIGNIADQRLLMPGMSCKVNLEKAETNEIIIPAGAIMTDIDGRYVWSVTEGVVDKNYVTVAGYAGDGILISEGLENVSYIIIEGARKVSTGMKVLTVE